MIIVDGRFHHALLAYGLNNGTAISGRIEKLCCTKLAVAVIARKTVDFPEALEPKTPITEGNRTLESPFDLRKHSESGEFRGTRKLISCLSAIEKKFSMVS
jgi:hypothetical protein